MTKKSTWEAFFDAHAPAYDDNVFTKNTIREVDFLLEELSLQPGGSILDVGCGTGRHAIELARRGYKVTGIDLSSEFPPLEGLPSVAVRERAFVPTELFLLFRLAGMPVLNLLGGTAGNWGRRTIDLDEIEIMVVARKTGPVSSSIECCTF